MTLASISVGDAIEYPGTGGSANPGGSHICIVVKIDNDDVYLVPISSAAANWDSTCEVGAGDHIPGITRNSFAAYFHAKKSSRRGMMTHTTAVNRGQRSAVLLQRIIAGVQSDDTEEYFKKALLPPAPTRRILPSSEGR